MQIRGSCTRPKLCPRQEQHLFVARGLSHASPLPRPLTGLGTFDGATRKWPVWEKMLVPSSSVVAAHINIFQTF